MGDHAARLPVRRNKMKRVLILGGGFGGLATAHELRRLRPDDEIVVVDRATQFLVGFRKTWAIFGDEEAVDAGRGNLADLENFGIRFRHGTVTAIYPEARAADVDGERLEADALVVALGSRLAVEATPGLSEHVYNLYDVQGLADARRAVHAFEGGRVSVGVYGLPYKCPPAPYEIAITATEFFKRRGVTATVEVFTPLPMSLPIAGEAGCGIVDAHMATHGVKFLPGHRATAVEAGAVFFGEQRLEYDLMLGVPPHRCPRVVQESGLATEGDWVRPDARTLETAYEGVYAIGDVTAIVMANDKPLPMAGVFAEGEGRVVAQRIADAFDGRDSEAMFDGKGGCFLEVGDGHAVMVEGDFLAQPQPNVALKTATRENLERKIQFEEERLRAWFGAPA